MLKKKQEETFRQLGCRLDRLLNRWLERVKASKKEDVINLMGFEQFYEAIPRECKSLIQDKEPHTVVKRAKIADMIFDRGDMVMRKLLVNSKVGMYSIHREVKSSLNKHKEFASRKFMKQHSEWRIPETEKKMFYLWEIWTG